MTSSIEQEANDNSTVESIGARLQRERRKQHKTLKEVADTTCIHIQALKALEADDHEQLPATVFVKGFIKLYAKFLNIDQEEALSYYEPPPRTEVLSGESNFYQEIITAEEKMEDESGVSLKKILLVVIIFIIIILLYVGSRIFISDTPGPETNLEQPNTISGEPTPPTATEQPSSSLYPAPASNENALAEAQTKEANNEEIIQQKTSTAGEIKDEIVLIPTPAPAPPAHIAELPTIDNNIHIAIVPEPTIEKVSKPIETGQNTMEIAERILPTASRLAENSQKESGAVPETGEPLIKVEPATEIALNQHKSPDVVELPLTPSPEIETTSASIPTPPQIIEAPKNDSGNITREADKDYKQVLVAEFVEPTWLKVQVDNKRARQYTYQPGASRTWNAHERIKIHLGNAGGVRLTLNGTPLPTPGKSGRTARITIPDDYLN